MYSLYQDWLKTLWVIMAAHTCRERESESVTSLLKTISEAAWLACVP